MSKNRVFRLAAIVAVLIVPFSVAGCLSSDMKLANKGFADIEGGRLVEAEKTLGEALQQNPNNPYALLDMGAVYQRTGRFDQAREMFEKVIALNPSEKPSKHSKFVGGSKTLKEIAADNLTTLPAKQ